jgi:hypothetical protein
VPQVQAHVSNASSTQPAYSTNVTLPELTWTGHAAMAAKVNAAVQSWALSQEHSFASAVQTDLAHASNLPASLPPSSLTITYKLGLATSRVVSYQFLVEPYYRGAANAGQTPVGLTFNLATGQQYSLPGLFRSGGGYVSTLADQAGTGLAGFSPAGAHCYLGQAPKAEAASFGAWWLSPTGLVLSFPAGTYTASYCGAPTVTVPR